MGYWENRQARQMYEFMEDAEAVSQELADLYAKASRQLNYKITEIFETFKNRYELSDEEALKLLNTLHDKTSIRELMDALAKDPKNKDLLRELESGAYRARIERLEHLQNEIDRMMQEIYKQEKKVSTDHYVDLASNSYYREIFDIQQQVGFQFSFSAMDPQAVATILASDWSGQNYSQRIWDNTTRLAQDVKEQLLLELLTGKKQEEIAREIAGKFATGAFNARRLIRTESNFISGQMQLQAYEECDAEQYDFVAVLDLRTSEICRSLDGQTFYVKDAQPGVNMNPMHPFCRSTTTIHLDDDVKASLKRRTRDPVTGEEQMVPATMNYKQWYQKYVANNPDAQAVEKGLKNRDADKALYEKYRRIYGRKEIGQTLEEFQNLKYTKPEKWEELKAGKQAAINGLSDKKIQKLNHLLGMKETRLWYKSKDEQIPELVAKIKGSLEDKAKKAHELRNQYRTQARELMKDQVQRYALDLDHPNLAFEQLMEWKKKKYGLTGDDAYQDIIRSSATTNRGYDKKAGVDK